jgi:hypothetical protein
VLGRLKAFFSGRRAEKQERLDEEYSTMTAEERERARAGAFGGAAGEVDQHYVREADRSEDAWEGRPPADAP